ncbi:MAG: hypothetical protein ABGZ35_08765, partial [Planctomycetaceae bacterium]
GLVRCRSHDSNDLINGTLSLLKKVEHLQQQLSVPRQALLERLHSRDFFRAGQIRHPGPFEADLDEHVVAESCDDRID